MKLANEAMRHEPARAPYDALDLAQVGEQLGSPGGQGFADGGSAIDRAATEGVYGVLQPGKCCALSRSEPAPAAVLQRSWLGTHWHQTAQHRRMAAVFFEHLKHNQRISISPPCERRGLIFPVEQEVERCGNLWRLLLWAS